MTSAHTNIFELAKEVIAAITAETAAYQIDGLSDEDAEAATERVGLAERALLAVPAVDVEAQMLATGDMDFICALALIQRRWLVMEGLYRQQAHAAECRLVDTLLSFADPFGDVPMLWHLDGQKRTERPSDAEFQAGWSE